MAVTVTNLGSANSVTTTATLGVTGVTAAVGDFLIIGCAANNAEASAGGSSTSATITDAAGNTWTRRIHLNYTSAGAANDGTTLSVWTSTLAFALSSATLTLNFSPSTVAIAALVLKVDGGSGAQVVYDSIGAGASGEGTSFPVTTNVPIGYTVFGFTALESSVVTTADSDTTNGSWSSAENSNAVLGSAINSQALQVQWKTVTATGNQNYNTAAGSVRSYAVNTLTVMLTAKATGVATGTGGTSGSVLSEISTLGTATGSGLTSGLAYQQRVTIGTATGSGDASGAVGGEYYTLGEATGGSISEGLTPFTTVKTPTQGTIYWQGFPGPAGYIDIPNFGQFPVNVGVSQLNFRDTVGYAYLLRATVPNQDDLETESYTTFYPAASFGRSSSPDDTPSNQYVPGALLGSTINYGIKLFDNIEPEASVSGGEGAIVLVDPKGELDWIVRDADGKDVPWDGAKLDILQGLPTAKFNTFSIVGKLTTAGILYDQRRKEFRLRDQADRLQKAGLHDQIFGGTGGSDGIPELEGIYKPYGVGPVFNTEPTLFDPPRQIRMLSCSKISSVRAIRDGGVSIAATGVDYPSYLALKAAADASAIPASHYSTCLNEGMIATGSIPSKQLTADFEGDATVINGTGYVSSLASILRRIATGRGDVKFADSDLDFAALNTLSQIQPDTCGWWWPSGSTQPTKAEVLAEIMNGRLGWWAVRLNGLLSFGIMDDPVGAPAMIINYPEDFAGEPTQLDTYQVPRKGTYGGYQKNYTIQDASQLNSDVVDAGNGLIYGQDALYAHANSTAPSWLWPTAQIVKVPNTGFEALEPTLAEVTRQQGVMGVRRERWSIPVPCSAFADVLGKIIQVNNYPRYNWGKSRKFICVGVSFASGIAVTLDLWG